MPLAIMLNDGPTGYKLDFRSKKFAVKVTADFVLGLKALGLGYALQKKNA